MSEVKLTGNYEVKKSNYTLESPFGLVSFRLAFNKDSREPLFFVVELKSDEKRTENEWPYIEGYSKKGRLIYDFSAEKIITSDALLSKDSDVVKTLSKILTEQVRGLVRRIKDNVNLLLGGASLPEEIKEEVIDVAGFLRLLEDMDEMASRQGFDGVPVYAQAGKARLIINFSGSDYALTSERGIYTIVPSDGIVSLGRSGKLIVNNREEVDELTFISKYIKPIIAKWLSRHKISVVEVLVPRQVFRQLVGKGLKTVLFLKNRLAIVFRPRGV